MTVVGDELVAFLYSDLSGLNRGRAVPAVDLERRLGSGVGWVPADQAITPFGIIGDADPWGPLGDVRLLPDPSTETRVDLWEDVTPLHFFLCDAVEIDGSPWDACTRTLLRGALERLQAETGLTLHASFEQEFLLEGGEPPPFFSLEALRAAEPFPGQLTAAFRLAGRPLETFLPEFGANQFELTLAPREALAACDDAAIARELVRETARRCGRRASFTPMADPDGSGNGLHVHLSLRREDGTPATYDATRPGRLSEIAGSFAAGIVRHLPALCAAAAPTPISYLRLVPHRWSAGYACLGERNREAALRIAPVAELPGSADPAVALNLEFRPADGACCPHLVLALLALTGLHGIRERLEQPPLVQVDPDSLTDAERDRLGVRRLPGSLEAALAELEADEVVRSLLAPDLLAAFLSMKRKELELVAGLDPREACARYLHLF
jgi:glutamine synthetase